MIKSFTWRIKDTFVDYVRRFGSVTVVEPAGEDGEGFVFPLEASESGLLRFKGSVEFSAHGGLLSACVANPWVHAESAGSYVTIDGTARTQTEGSRLRLAEIAGAISPDAVLGTYSAVLSEVGVALFEYRYEAGDSLAHVRLA
ncbi:hypothetical protein LMG24238_06701 [Paraburkholderia sediminicola]|uniref:Htaa domain-containing protein n=1 Tax=Paraburkholderia sediminicola TaxID=458836 RepID=A0A6J5CML5_9BURK|nr:HtaA domain-containing protein [Paraburkholderia sediminicola]CAB3740988.1 hypothetical protein LMG24238_06701 [Paraburkholderia sediminicola]